MRTWVVILVVTLSVLIFMFTMPIQGSPPFDPFLPYADLLAADRVIPTVRNARFACQETYEAARTRCSMKPVDSVFSEIFVTINGDQPEGISFEVFQNKLHVGDLAALWGKPDSTISGAALWLEWDGAQSTALVRSANRLNYLIPVTVVSFTF